MHPNIPEALATGSAFIRNPVEWLGPSSVELTPPSHDVRERGREHGYGSSWTNNTPTSPGSPRRFSTKNVGCGWSFAATPVESRCSRENGRLVLTDQVTVVVKSDMAIQPSAEDPYSNTLVTPLE